MQHLSTTANKALSAGHCNIMHVLSSMSENNEIRALYEYVIRSVTRLSPQLPSKLLMELIILSLQYFMSFSVFCLCQILTCHPKLFPPLAVVNTDGESQVAVLPQ